MDLKKIFDIALSSCGNPKEALAITKEIKEFFQEERGDKDPPPLPRIEFTPVIVRESSPRRAGKPWSEEEINELIALYANGLNYAGIARKLDRSIHAVETAIYKFNTGRQLGKLKKDSQ